MKLVISFFALCASSPIDSLKKIAENAENLIEEHFQHRTNEEILQWKKFYSRKHNQMKRLMFNPKCRVLREEKFDPEVSRICTGIEGVMSTQRKSSKFYSTRYNSSF